MTEWKQKLLYNSDELEKDIRFVEWMRKKFFCGENEGVRGGNEKGKYTNNKFKRNVLECIRIEL